MYAVIFGRKITSLRLLQAIQNFLQYTQKTHETEES